MALQPQDHAHIEAAIRAAEARTSGEIFCVVTEEVSGWWETPLIAAAIAALVLPGALLLAAPDSLLALTAGGWSSGHLTAVEGAARAVLAVYALAQAAIFVVAAAVVSFTPLRRWLTPEAVKQRRMHQAALAQFLAQGLSRTRERTGVLIFASLRDRRAVVLADEGIAAKVGPEVWMEAMAALVDGMAKGRPGEGFAAAVEACAAVLAEHFPPRGDNPDELPNRLVEI